MAPLNRLFRKYHRQLGLIFALPLIVVVLSGMGAAIADEWFEQGELAEFLLKVHTLRILHLDKVFSVITGIGLMGLLVTGISMTGLFRSRPQSGEH